MSVQGHPHTGHPDREAALAKAAGRLLRAQDGPRIAALDLDGWDTHRNQDARLPDVLRQLDTGLAAMKAAAEK